MESVVKHLYRSRKWVGGRYGYNGEVVGLVLAIESKAAERGLTLSRWQTNSTRNSHICTVAYALHTGARPASSYELPEDATVVRFNGLEGMTQKCRAYRELWKLFCSMV